jgi:hypothetical protein
VFSGRRRTALVAAIAAIACVSIPVGAGAAAAPVAELAAKKKIKSIFLKGKVVSDGIVTPGQLETIAISRMPRRARVKVFIEPPPTTPQCGEFYFCDVAPTSLAPGSPPYRTSGKGRALLTFVMPSTYYIELDPFDPRDRMAVEWADGQSVHIDVQAARTHKHVRHVGFGFGRAILQR